MSKNYLLIIDTSDDYNPESLIKKLDLCVDWTRVLDATYLIRSTSDKETLYNRFKIALDDAKFFLIEVDLSDNYTGWLIKNKWERIKEIKI